MILDELTLRNFGLFAGEQAFTLKPGQRAGQHLPIVLFGGLNGGGKTTLFDAIQLVLYGPRARCSKRASLSYEDFLKQSIHHGVSLAQGAAVALTFRYSEDGEEHLYEIRRSPARVLQKVSDYLAADREARTPSSTGPNRLGLSEEARSLLHRLLAGKLDESISQTRLLLSHLTKLTEEKDNFERSLAAAPEDADIAAVSDQLKTAVQARTLLDEQIGRLKEEIKSKRAELGTVERKLRSLWKGNIEKRFEKEDLHRMLNLAGKTREVMEAFLGRALERKIDRLSEFITESFRFLLRKQTLLGRVTIDPVAFAITLYDTDEHPIPKQRLSEGEKQLFAIAVLWGLARAAVRPLPAVIDTPMARLDASHRQHLVERYFPNASHQVIILSTDTEVDRGYYDLLQPFVARAYRLNYDEQRRSAIANEGYFPEFTQQRPRDASI
jgi:DNA sulfur modification protein DndD